MRNRIALHDMVSMHLHATMMQVAASRISPEMIPGTPDYLNNYATSRTRLRRIVHARRNMTEHTVSAAMDIRSVLVERSGPQNKASNERRNRLRETPQSLHSGSLKESRSGNPCGHYDPWLLSLFFKPNLNLGHLACRGTTRVPPASFPT